MVFNSHNLLIPAGNLSQAGPSMCPSGTQCRSCLLERGLMSEVAAALSPARMRCVKWSGTSNVDWSPAWVSTRCSAYFTSSWCLRWPSPGRITLLYSSRYYLLHAVLQHKSTKPAEYEPALWRPNNAAMLGRVSQKGLIFVQVFVRYSKD